MAYKPERGKVFNAPTVALNKKKKTLEEPLFQRLWSQIDLTESGGDELSPLVVYGLDFFGSLGHCIGGEGSIV